VRRQSVPFVRLHRLHAAGEIDDGKSAMTETDMAIDPNAARIRAAARHRLRHRFDDVALRLDIAIVANPTSNAAHRVILSNGHPRVPTGGDDLRPRLRLHVTAVKMRYGCSATWGRRDGG